MSGKKIVLMILICILLLSKGKPVRGRSGSIVAFVFLSGCVSHLIGAAAPAKEGLAHVGELYQTGMLGLSGGVDSAWLLHEAAKYAQRTAAYFVHTPFQPAFELADARETAEKLGVELRVLELDPVPHRVLGVALPKTATRAASNFAAFLRTKYPYPAK